MPDLGLKAKLQILIDELDELSAWLWMHNELDVAVKLDNVINKYRPEGMVGD